MWNIGEFWTIWVFGSLNINRLESMYGCPGRLLSDILWDWWKCCCLGSFRPVSCSFVVKAWRFYLRDWAGVKNFSVWFFRVYSFCTWLCPVGFIIHVGGVSAALASKFPYSVGWFVFPRVSQCELTVFGFLPVLLLLLLLLVLELVAPLLFFPVLSLLPSL